jgi:succinyl-diaminopimelate desuccinylase
MSDNIDSSMVDPVALAQDLIRCPSVTPTDAGALGVLEAALKPLGFTCHRLRFEAEGTPPVENLYARLGTAGPNFCFAGHTDVVPPGDTTHWKHTPYEAAVENGLLYGRGAVDMKSAIAAFVAAVSRYLGEANEPKGSISLLITGDEEGPAINGTVKVLQWMKERGETIDRCVVGEPASVARSGDVLKIGRRGSMNVTVTVKGIQGHTAYPQNALNPIPVLAEYVQRLSAEPLDGGTAEFEPSTVAFTSFDVGNPTTNVIPAEACAAFNVRFNDLHMPDTLTKKFEALAAEIGAARGGEIRVTVTERSGVAFVTKPGSYTDLLSGAVERVTGSVPEFSAGGGTSDARFIKDYCPVVELGLPGKTMHKVDECVPVSEIETLTKIYREILDSYFSSAA